MNQHTSVSGKPEINVTVPERIVSVLAGTYLLFRALKKRNLGIINGAAAGFLLYRGLSGHCPGYKAMNKKKLSDQVPEQATIVDPIEDPQIINKIVTP